MSAASATAPVVDAGGLRAFHDLRKAIQTPDQLGWAVVNAALTEGPTRGTLTANGIEVPMKALITLPTAEGARTIVEICITMFDHRIICMQAHIEQ